MRQSFPNLRFQKKCLPGGGKPVCGSELSIDGGRATALALCTGFGLYSVTYSVTSASGAWLVQLCGRCAMAAASYFNSSQTAFIGVLRPH